MSGTYTEKPPQGEGRVCMLKLCTAYGFVRLVSQGAKAVYGPCHIRFACPGFTNNQHRCHVMSSEHGLPENILPQRAGAQQAFAAYVSKFGVALFKPGQTAV